MAYCWLANHYMRINFNVVCLVVFSLQPSLSLGNSCHAFYDGHTGSETSGMLLDQIKAKLAADPNGFPEYVIGQAMAQDLLKVTQQYQATMEKIAVKGPNNKADFAVKTVSAVLDNFSRLALSLGKELDKEKRDLKRIQRESEELQLCFQNIKKCEANLPIAVRAARENLLQSKQLVFQLEKKKREIDELSANFIHLNDLPALVLDSLDRALKMQGQVIVSYLELLKSAVEIYEQIETQLRVQTPEIQTALLEIALLQSRGARIEGSLEMNSAIDTNSSAVAFSREIYSFVTPTKNNEKSLSSMGKLITNEFFKIEKNTRGSFLGLNELIILQRKLHPDYNEQLNIYDIENVIRKLLVKPNSDYRLIFEPVLFDGFYKFKFGSHINDTNLHFFLFMIDGFNPLKYREAIKWLVSILSSTLTEVAQSDLGFFEKRRRSRNIKDMIIVYESYQNSTQINSDLNILLDINGRNKLLFSLSEFKAEVPINFIQSN